MFYHVEWPALSNKSITFIFSFFFSTFSFHALVTSILPINSLFLYRVADIVDEVPCKVSLLTACLAGDTNGSLAPYLTTVVPLLTTYISSPPVAKDFVSLFAKMQYCVIPKEHSSFGEVFFFFFFFFNHKMCALFWLVSFYHFERFFKLLAVWLLLITLQKYPFFFLIFRQSFFYKILVMGRFQNLPRFRCRFL